jgi:hypothetical protein
VSFALRDESLLAATASWLSASQIAAAIPHARQDLQLSNLAI